MDKIAEIFDNGKKINVIKDVAVKTIAKENGKSFQKIVKLPFGKTLFFKAFAIGCKSGFGAEAGFANVVHKATSKEYKMDIIACPYVKYCESEGCPELTHIFCDNDIYAYGYLNGILGL